MLTGSVTPEASKRTRRDPLLDNLSAPLGARDRLDLHTDRGTLVFTDDEVKGQQNRKWGIKPKPAPEAFTALEEDVRRSIRRIQRARLYPKGSVRGLYTRIRGRVRSVAQRLSTSRKGAGHDAGESVGAKGAKLLVARGGCSRVRYLPYNSCVEVKLAPNNKRAAAGQGLVDADRRLDGL